MENESIPEDTTESIWFALKDRNGFIKLKMTGRNEENFVGDFVVVWIFTKVEDRVAVVVDVVVEVADVIMKEHEKIWLFYLT